MVGRAVNHAENRAVALNDAGAFEVGRDIDAAVGHEQAGKLLLHDAAGAVDVEDGDNDRVFARGIADERNGVVEGISLDADENHIGRGRALRLRGEKAVHVECFDGNGPGFAVALLEGQALFLHGFEVCAAGDERDICTEFC